MKRGLALILGLPVAALLLWLLRRSLPLFAPFLPVIFIIIPLTARSGQPSLAFSSRA